MQMKVFFLTAILIVVMSLAALIAFVRDKKKAKAGAPRTKEKTLLGLAAFFGAPGALVGRIVAHHKTDKVYFGIVIWVSLILQAAVLIFTAYLALFA